MGSRSNASLDEDALRLWTRALDVRTIFLVSITCIALVVPFLPGRRWEVLALLGFVVVPYNILLAQRVRRRHRLDPWMPLTDLALAAAMAAVVPDTWPAVVAVSVADIGLAVVMFGRKVAIVSTLIGAAILGAAAVRVEDGASTGVSGFIAAAAIVITTVGFVSNAQRETRQRYTSLVNGIQGVVWEFDPSTNRLTFVSRQVESLLGRTPEELLETESFGDLLHPDDRCAAAARVQRALARIETPTDYRMLHADGRWIWFSDIATVEWDEHGRPRVVRGIAVDATEQHNVTHALQQSADRLRQIALHDSLTGLPNRSLLQDRLALALASARRTGQQVALLVMDLDQFKEINDTLGHPTGDRMLEQVGSRLAHVLRDCDTVARLGGDEFAVLLTVDVSLDGAQGVALRIQDALQRPFDLDGLAVQMAASIGIVLSPEHGTDAETLVQRADIAMYNAKRSGRGHAFYAAQDDRSSVRRLALVGELRGALERDELVLHYQPQIDVRSGSVVGVEALVRWEHPEHGLLPPSEFISLAEVSGIIQPLTRWVVRAAAAHAADLARAGHHLVVSANVSARNLYDPHLVKEIGSSLRAFGVSPDLLMLELTESELVDDPSQVMTVLSLVSDMGVRLSIDDFGTGWSSLANLTRLPIHQIKIDKSFVSRMLFGGDDAVIVRSIVDLGHNLGLAVVAEGVENVETLAALRELGCDHAQGYLLSRPVPGDELLTWLSARGSTAAVFT